MCPAVPLGVVVYLMAAGPTGEGKTPPQPSKESYFKVLVDVEMRGALAHTDKATTVTARTRAYSRFNDAEEVPAAAGPTVFTLDFSDAKDLRELAKALSGREVVVTGKSELRLVTDPTPPRAGGLTGFQPVPFIPFPAPTWSVQRTVRVTVLKSAPEK